MGQPVKHPSPRSSQDRRAFFRRPGSAAAALAGAAMLPMGGRAAGGRVDAGVFQHGVASGDPLHDRVVLWTRVTPPEGLARVRVDDVVTRDPALTDVVLTVRLLTTASRDFTVKPDVSGLQPGTSYCYAFTAQGEMSAVGRTRTLPVCAVDRLRMAVTSCSNHPAGYFNAYARIAERADLADIVMLEARLQACSQQLEATIPVPGLGNAFQQQGEFLDPSRTLLGERQEVWLAGQLRTSRAGWKCIGQQVMFGQLKAQGAPLAAGGGLFFNADQWDGYQPARDRVYDIIKGKGPQCRQRRRADRRHPQFVCQRPVAGPEQPRHQHGRLRRGLGSRLAGCRVRDHLHDLAGPERPGGQHRGIRAQHQPAHEIRRLPPAGLSPGRRDAVTRGG